MKLALSICAKELPAVGNYYAKATVDELIGQTDVIKGSASPSWNSVLTFEHDSASSKTLTVQVCSEKDGAIVSTISMPTAQLLEQSAVALDGDGASGSAVIAVHCQEYTLQPGTLQLQLRGVNLKNMERGLGWIRKSDPYFELLKSMDGEPFYKSESVRNDQSPKWKLANIDLEPLYAAGCDLDSTLTLVVWDKDRRGKRDLMGQVDTTLTTLLHAKDVECAGGKLIVVRAHRVGHGGTAVSEAATQAMENAANALLSKQSMEKAKQVAAQSQERAVALQKVAEQKVAARTQAAQETVEAQALVGELEAEAKQVAVGAKTQKCTGSLHLTLRCANLRNTDGFFNKSDPFYVLEGADGSSVYKSEIVEDNLDPKFKMATIDLWALTKGDLDAPLRLVLHDKDGGAETEYLGQLVTTVMELSQAKEFGGAIELMSGAAATQGHMYVDAIELVEYKDLEEEAVKLVAVVAAAKTAIPAQQKAERAAVEEAKRAQDNANKAKQAAEAAQKQVEAMMAAREIRV